MVELGAVFAGAALTSIVLAGAHLALWERRSGLWLVWRYTVGVAGINAGLTLTGVLLTDVRLAVYPWLIAGAAGLVTLLLHLWRRQEDAPAAKALLRRAYREANDGRERGPDARGH